MSKLIIILLGAMIGLLLMRWILSPIKNPSMEALVIMNIFKVSSIIIGGIVGWFISDEY